MNLVGKIFTVLIFVMSLVFATFCVMVYGAHTNWRDMVKNTQASADMPLGFEVQVREANAENDTLQNELTKILAEHDEIQKSSRQEVTQLENEKVRLEGELATQNTEVTRLTGLEQDHNSSMEAIGNSLGNMRDEVAVLRNGIRDAEIARDEHFAASVARTDELHALANEYTALQGRSAELIADYDRAKKLLTLHGLSVDSVADTSVPPTVDGKVLASRANGLIEISIGSDDGLAKGHELHVYRMTGAANTYLGKVRVTQTAADRSVCQVLPQFRKGAIQVGDNVASKLSSGS